MDTPNNLPRTIIKAFLCITISTLLAFSLVFIPISQARAEEASPEGDVVLMKEDAPEVIPETPPAEPEPVDDTLAAPEETEATEGEGLVGDDAESAELEATLLSEDGVADDEEAEDLEALDDDELSTLAGVDITAANFPDAAFFSYVLGLDSNGDLKLSDTEIQAVTSMSIGGLSIGDLTGIAYFTELSTLDCSYNALVSLNLSANTKLTTLNCIGNSLSSLNTASNPVLTTLYCAGNSLSSLDLSGNASLTVLDCSGNNLTSLNLSGNTGLTVLSCGNNNLSSLNLSSNTRLTDIDITYNALTSIDLSSLSELVSIEFYGNSFTALDFRNNKKLVSAWHATGGEIIYISAGMLNYIGCPAVSSHTGNLVIDLAGYYTTQPDGSVTVDLNAVLSPTMIAQITEPASSLYDPATGILTIPAGSSTAVIAASDSNVYTFHKNYGTLVKHTVTYMDGSNVHHQEIVDTGNTATAPAAPIKEGYVLAGWFYDPTGTTAHNFSTAITSDLTLHAVWKPQNTLPRTGDNGVGIATVLSGVFALAGFSLMAARKRVALNK